MAPHNLLGNSGEYFEKIALNTENFSAEFADYLLREFLNEDVSFFLKKDNALLKKLANSWKYDFEKHQFYDFFLNSDTIDFLNIFGFSDKMQTLVKAPFSLQFVNSLIALIFSFDNFEFIANNMVLFEKVNRQKFLPFLQYINKYIDSNS